MSDPGNTVQAVMWLPERVCCGHGMYLFPSPTDDRGLRRCRATEVTVEPNRSPSRPGRNGRRAVT